MPAPALPAGLPPELSANAEHLWQFLNELSENDPGEYDAFLKRQMQAAGGGARQALVPKPGFCVQLRQGPSRALVLVNVCAHDRMAPPSASPDGSIPIAVGVPRALVHGGKPAHSSDVIVNTEVVAKAETDAAYREELAALATQCVNEVLGERSLLPGRIHPGYRVVPVGELRYAGEPASFVDARDDAKRGETGGADGATDAAAAAAAAAAGLPGGAAMLQQLASLGGLGGGGLGGGGARAQRPPAAAEAETVGEDTLRLPGGASVPRAKSSDAPAAPRGPLVQELGPVETRPEPAPAATPAAAAGTPETPEHELRPADGGGLTLRVLVPRVAAASELDVSVGERAVELSAEGVYKLRVPLPHAVADADARCRFDKKRRALTITLPPREPP